MNLIGWHPIMRMCFNNSIFAVPDQPGTPALAFATTENGVVTGITVTNGGSGYLPLNFGGTEAQAVTVLITTGYVTNIFYR